MRRTSILGFGFAIAVVSTASVPSLARADPPALELACAIPGERTDVVHLIDTDADALGETVAYCRDVLGGHPIGIRLAKSN